MKIVQEGLAIGANGLYIVLYKHAGLHRNNIEMGRGLQRVRSILFQSCSGAKQRI